MRSRNSDSGAYPWKNWNQGLEQSIHAPMFAAARSTVARNNAEGSDGVNGWAKQGCAHNGILSSLRKEGNSYTPQHGWSLENTLRGNKPDTKGQILRNSTTRVTWTVTFRDRKQSGGHRELEEQGASFDRREQFQSGMAIKFWRWMVVIHSSANVLSVTKGTLKNGKL